MKKGYTRKHGEYWEGEEHFRVREGRRGEHLGERKTKDGEGAVLQVSIPLVPLMLLVRG